MKQKIVIIVSAAVFVILFGLFLIALPGLMPEAQAQTSEQRFQMDLIQQLKEHNRNMERIADALEKIERKMK